MMAVAATTTLFLPWTRRPLTTTTASAGRLRHRVHISTAANLNWSKKSRTTCLSSLIPQEEEEEEEQVEAEPTTTQQPPAVSVPVSPSDLLTMFFQAEGTMSEATIPTVMKALEETEGISNLTVKVLEGIASVDLKKQTTVQATGVASSLVEIIQGSGFKLQTLNLSFKDEGLD